LFSTLQPSKHNYVPSITAILAVFAFLRKKLVRFAKFVPPTVR